jgi:hypothetical protein
MSDPKATRGAAPYRRTRVFISYRRSGNAGDAERLYDELKKYLSARHLFLDVKSIERGDRFPLAIETALASSRALLAVIGPRWLGSSDEQGRRRLDDPSDMLRREVSAALARDAWVIPVLMHGAAMPDEKDLPDDLKRLAHCQAVEIRSGHWETDVRELVGLLKRRLYRGKRLVTALSFAAALAVSAALTYHFATVAMPVNLKADGPVAVPSVEYHYDAEEGQTVNAGEEPRELVVEGLTVGGADVFRYDGMPASDVSVDCDSGRFDVSMVSRERVVPSWTESWKKVVYMGGDEYVTPLNEDYERVCATSVSVTADDGGAPTTLRFYQLSEPSQKGLREIYLRADRQLIVSTEVRRLSGNNGAEASKPITNAYHGAGCSKRLQFGKEDEERYLVEQNANATFLVNADTQFAFGLLPIDNEKASQRDDVLRLGDGVHVEPFNLKATPLRARRVVVRARGTEEIPCDDEQGREPTTYFEARSADGKSSLRLQRLEIGADYFRLDAEGQAYVTSKCVTSSPDIFERAGSHTLRAALLLAFAAVAITGLVYSVARL